MQEQFKKMFKMHINKRCTENGFKFTRKSHSPAKKL